MRTCIATISLVMLAACASMEQDPEHDVASATRICMRTTPMSFNWNERFQDCIKSYGHNP